jgi:hypothetical protein
MDILNGRATVCDHFIVTAFSFAVTCEIIKAHEFKNYG